MIDDSETFSQSVVIVVTEHDEPVFGVDRCHLTETVAVDVDSVVDSVVEGPVELAVEMDTA
ncbi:MAG TPA: hypothetical protein VIW24_30255 [Aldersonia sp.]